MLRAAGGAPVEGLAHLPDARRPDEPAGRRRFEAPLVPFEIEATQEPGHHRPWLAHEFVVGDVDDVTLINRLPMKHQSSVLPIVMSYVHETQGIAHALVEMQEENRQAVVERVSCRMDDLCLWEQALDQPHIEEVVGTLVGNEVGSGKSRGQRAAVLRGQRPQAGRRRGGGALRIRPQSMLGDRRQEVELTPCLYPRVARKQLLEQGRAGTEHPADKDGARRLSVPPIARASSCSRGGECRHDPVDEPCLGRWVVRNEDGTCILATQTVRQRISVESGGVIAAGVEGPPERKADAGPSGRADIGTGQRFPQPADERIRGIGELSQVGVASQGLEVVRIQGENPLYASAACSRSPRSSCRFARLHSAGI